MRNKRLYLLFVCLIAVSVVALLKPVLRELLPIASAGAKTVDQRLNQFGEAARQRMRDDFLKAGVPYPPAKVVLVGLKAEKELQVFAPDRRGAKKFVCSYPILAASGYPGPKLREGDEQVPEGIYPIELLNPNSAFHVSLRVGYPNAFDKAQARKEGRGNLGGDIMIHGGAASIGCLAMGDEVAEELFTLAADVGIKKVTLILSPVDFRAGRTVPGHAKLPTWTEPLYKEIKTQLAELPSEAPK